MRNPELTRNLWLEFTPHRLIITPIVMMTTFFLLYKIGSDSTVTYGAMILYLFFAYVWGTRSASDAICDEVNNNTWDWQRTSQLSPLQMSFGKLFGSTCFAWYGAAIALATYIWFGRGSVNLLEVKVFVLVVGAVLTQALALLLSFESLKSPGKGKIRSFNYFFTGLLIGSYITYQVYLFSTQGIGLGQVGWYQFKFDIIPFALTSLSIFCLWSLVAVYRGMRLELQYHNIPWVFASFALYVMIYFAGFPKLTNFESFFELGKARSILESAPLFTAFVIAVVLTYIVIFTDKISKLHYHKLLTAFKFRGPRKGLEKLPRWPIAFGLALATGLWYSTTKGVSIEGAGQHFTFSPATLSFSILLLLARDCLIAHYFKFGSTIKRTNLTILFYLLVLYGLMPWLLMVLHFYGLAACFRPGIGEYPGYSILGPGIQVLIVGFLVLQRWRSGST